MKQIIVGACIRKEDKILMIKEGKIGKSSYGLWNYPAGRLKLGESIFDGAIREVKEETGYNIELSGVLPIVNYFSSDEEDDILIIMFVGKIVGGDINFNKEEILDLNWIPINELKEMTSKELRGINSSKIILESIEENIILPLNSIINIVNK